MRRGESVAVLLEVARVHLLFELVPNGDAQDWLSEVDRLVHQRETAVRHDGACGRKIAHELLLGKSVKRTIPFDGFATEPIHDELVRAKAIERSNEPSVARGRLIDEHVLAARSARLQ